MRFQKVLLDYFPLKGGLDLVSPPLAVKPGFCREAQNFEIGVSGGYKTVGGYERYDGHASPSVALYVVLPCTITGTIAVGNTVTGLASSATGEVVLVDTTFIVITKLAGTFTSSEALRVSGVTQATMSGDPVTNGAATEKLNWQYKNLAADAYRANISAVPGSGSILGVAYYAGALYAFRNNAGGTAAVMYKATGSGWSLVTTPALAPNGRYEFDQYNFGTAVKLYGCDGVNKGFQFDGTTFTQLTTGMTTDTPDHVAAHKNHLFFSFDNSLQHSSIGDPTTWSVITGAAELNMGETITNLVPQTGDANSAALAIWTRNATFILYGNSSAAWNLVTLQSDAGALPYTAQYFAGNMLCLDDRGVSSLTTSQNYGNFDAASLSKLVRPWIIENKAGIIASGVSHGSDQYRLFFTGGRALYMTIDGGFMPMLFAHDMTCYTSAEDANGDEIMFAGADDGMVYQFDKGTSFDGEEIECYIGLVFNHQKSPRQLKSYRKAVIEVQGGGYSEFWTSADLSYSNTDVEPIPLAQSIAELSAGKWDTGVWDVGVWDGRILAPSEFEVIGTGENIALRFAQASDYMAPLTFYGVLIHYTPRRSLR